LIIIGGLILVKNIRREMQLALLKSDFVSNVSHELRTPLALIRMYAETLEMDRVKTDEKRYEYYRIINQESERLTRLINNILNFSRIESGRKEYKFSSVNINKVIQGVFDMYSYHIEQEGFVLNIELNEQIPEILADTEAVSEAFINLIDNAIKYSKDIKEISVRTGQKDNFVFLEVQDKGIGIEQTQQSAIFEKFYRISSALVHDTKGSGLGLSLVQHIMNSHEGKIILESEPNKGSKFRLLFPIKISESH
jgi:two-component system phosphate regulon sensor histidine kinase PhoR